MISLLTMRLGNVTFRLCSKLRFKFMYKKYAVFSFHILNGPRLLNKNISFTTTFVGFHTTTVNNAKSFQEKENEYAHSVMESISDYGPSVLKCPLESSFICSLKSNTSVVDEFVKKELSQKKYSEMASEPQHLVFVYGTLKKGEPNHDLLQPSSKALALFKGKAKTVKKWPLVIASRFNIPYLLYAQDKGEYVVGELYQVNEAMLSEMDELECHPGYYTRILEEVEVLSDEPRVVKPWIYFLKNFRAELLSLPYLVEYSSKGSHGLEYVSRYKRPIGVHYYSDVMNL